MKYLGFEQFQNLLQMTQKYHNAINEANLADEENEEALVDIEVESEASLDEDTQFAKNREKMIHLDDPIVNALFISIIHLIEYFCKESEINTKNKLFSSISQSLNENRREDALFNCLNIMDDNVRLAVVQCLFVVKLDDFDSDEISKITRIMSNCNNIGAGKTEMVLSTIYWICTKFVVKPLQEPDIDHHSSDIFMMKFGEKSIKDAINILHRNLIRDVQLMEDDEEKYTLSVSILNFIKASSKASKMKQYLVDKQDVFKQILISEDRFSTERVKQLPIDIENSIIGREIRHLMEVISGGETLQPYSDVSLRLIMRMADVLMFRHHIMYVPIDESTEDIQDTLMSYQMQIYKKKKQQELAYWVDKPDDFLESLKKLDEDGFQELEEQHTNFLFANGISGYGF